MAQANCLISSIRALFTGATSQPSTNADQTTHVFKSSGGIFSDLAFDVTDTLRCAAGRVAARRGA